nr:general transcription factor IIH subunit 2-like protein [Oryctolagus cuniculus]
MDEEPERTKRWEGGYERTWEILKEDESGSLKATIEDILFKAKRKRVFEHHGQVRLGMMRHLYVVVDGSRTMEDQDLKPNRLTCTLKLLEYFVEEYFDQNPISQIGIIVTKSKRAEKLTELSGNPRKHITSLKKAVDMTCHGEPSLYNSLSMAMQTLKHMPGHTSREVLIIFSSLTTCDPSNIYDLIKTLKAAKIRVSVIGLSAEVRVCTVLARETGGTYHVILDESHYKELLTHHVSPPPASSSSECSLIRMGFPQHTIASLSDQDAKPSFSMAHLDSSTEPGLTLGGYFCPQCRAKYCELPVECKICGLTLVSAPHLARSYHHLFPLDPFQEIPLEENKGERFCYGCQGELKDQHVYVCSACQNVFCVDCDVFVHDSLHCCPGCIHKLPAPSVASFVTGYEEILESFSKCEFLQSKKTSEEIIQYIQSYEGIVDMTLMAMTASLLMKTSGGIPLRTGPTSHLWGLRLWPERVFSTQAYASRLYGGVLKLDDTLYQDGKVFFCS